MISKIYLPFISMCLAITQAQSAAKSDEMSAQLEANQLLDEMQESNSQASRIGMQLQTFREETEVTARRLYEDTVRPRLVVLDDRIKELEEGWEPWRTTYKLGLSEKYDSYSPKLLALTEKKVKAENFLNAVYNLYHLYSEWDEHEGDLSWIDACADREYVWSRLIEDEQKYRIEADKLSEKDPEDYRTRVLEQTLPKDIFAAYSDFWTEREKYHAKKKEIKDAIDAIGTEKDAAHAEYYIYRQARGAEEAAMIAEMVRYQRQSQAAKDRLKTEFGI